MTEKEEQTTEATPAQIILMIMILVGSIVMFLMVW